MTDYEFHPAAAIFPLLEEGPLKLLAADIKLNGLLNPITLTGDKTVDETVVSLILDGRNRYLACQKAKVEPHFDIYEGDDPVGFVISQNAARRQLDESQRAMCAARAANMPQGFRSDQPSADLRNVMSQPQAAAKFDVSTRLVQQANVVIKNGHEALIRAVDAGMVSIHRALEIIEEAPDDQATLAVLSSEDLKINLDRMKRDKRRKAILARGGKKGLPEEEAKWSVFLVDPPWADEFGITDRAVENHYAVMPLADIMGLGVDALAHDDAILFLWALPHMIQQALAVIAAWGFEYRTHMIWVKDRPGMGQWVRNQHEILMIARRGEFPTPREEDRSPSCIAAPVGEHSAKPEIFAELIEKWYPEAHKIELFRRGRPRRGWSAWGLETEPAAAE